MDLKFGNMATKICDYTLVISEAAAAARKTLEESQSLLLFLSTHVNLYCVEEKEEGAAVMGLAFYAGPSVIS